jgi:polar amino acid transport system substrate-binding protein
VDNAVMTWLARLVLSGALAAAPPAWAAGEQPVLRAVVGDNNAPFNYLEQGQLKGMCVEVAQELARRAGFKLAAEPLPWARALATARSEPSVLVLTVARTAERETWFSWIGPIADREIWLWKLSSRTDVAPRSIADLKHYRIGDTLNNASVDTLKEKGIEAEVVTHDGQNGKKMLAGRIDLVPMNPYSIEAFAAEGGIPLKQLEPTLLLSRSGGYYLAVNRDSDRELVRRLNAAFDAIKTDGTLHAIVTKWSPSVAPVKAGK